MRSRWLLVLGIVLAVTGGILIFAYLQGLDRRVAVVVAARDLYPYEVIQSSDLRVCHLPEAALHPDALRSSNEAVGRLMIQPVFVGEQLHAARTDLGLTGRPVNRLEASQRAMFVAAGFARAAGASICPGDRVDLVAVISGRGDPVAYRLAVDLEVLELRDERGNQLTGGQSKAGMGGALLAVPEPLVEPIALAMSCGHVYMVVRGVMAHDDAAQVHPGGVTVK